MTRSDRRWFISGVDWTLRIVGVLSFVVAGFAYTETRNQARETNDLAECQAKVNAAILQRSKNLDADLTREREASRRVDDALAAVITAALSGSQDPYRSRALVTALSAALTEQKKARVDADEARAKNPPIEPETAC